MKCPRCQQENATAQEFCGHCGSPVGGMVSSGSYGDLQAVIERLRRSLDEAAEQQTATAEILHVISDSPTDLQAVLDAVAASAARLCDSVDAQIFRIDGMMLRIAASYGQIPKTTPAEARHIGRGSVNGRAVLDRRTIHVHDLAAESDTEFPEGKAYQKRFGHRTIVATPLLRQGTPIGAITIRRMEVRPFSEKEVKLLETFADQAVIAIENARLLNETKGALEQQTATSEILRVIASSPTDVQPVFDTILASATTLLGGFVASITRRVDDDVHMVAFTSISESLDATVRQSYPVSIDSPNPHSLAIRRCEPHIIADADTQPDIPEPVRRMARARGWRSNLAVPLRRTGSAIGALGVSRRDARGFTPDEIALLQTFADQAVIAIENVRLFTQLQEKNLALTEAHAQVTEALEQQTATAEILRVISRSQTDVQPVFDAIVASAVRLLEADSGLLTRIAGDQIEIAALTSTDPAGDAILRAAYPLSRHSDRVHARVIRDRAPLNVADAQTDPRLPDVQHATARARGYRSHVAVPLLRHDEALGAIAVTRHAPGGFTEDEVVLLQTFADQAVIAIENARLLSELQEKNYALTQAHAQVSEALEQQTATSELLKVIGRSTFDLQPVFETLAENAVRLCEAERALIWRYDGQLLRVAAAYNLSRELRAFAERTPIAPGRHSGAARAALERHTIHIHDILADPEYTYGAKDIEPHRTILAVPMLRINELLGVILIHRHEVCPFTDSQIALMETFADQAAIAIENARLLTELQTHTTALTRSVDELTALGDVSRALSSTLDLETVLTTIVSRAIQLSGTDGGSVYEYDEATEEFSLRASRDLPEAYVEQVRGTRPRKGEGAVGRVAQTRAPVQIADISDATTYESRFRDMLLQIGLRALLAVPLIAEDRLVGALIVMRKRTGTFAAEEVALLQTFAIQSALAIQNARLFREIEQKSRELEAASHHKSEFLANMSHELRTPLNAIIGFSEVLSERMFGELNEKQAEYLKDIHASGQHLLSLINDILDLSKIEAGKMELEVSDFDLPMTIDNALMLIRERAARRSIALNTTIDERLGQIQADERKIRQVLLNLLSNAIKFTPEGGRIEVGAKPVDGFIEVAVIDTGVGIAPEDQEAIFEEFKQVGTADKKVEGTGLGLALSRKFIELHGGKIRVKSQVGTGSTFTFTIPVRRDE